MKRFVSFILTMCLITGICGFVTVGVNAAEISKVIISGYCYNTLGQNVSSTAFLYSTQDEYLGSVYSGYNQPFFTLECDISNNSIPEYIVFTSDIGNNKAEGVYYITETDIQHFIEGESISITCPVYTGWKFNVKNKTPNDLTNYITSKEDDKVIDEETEIQHPIKIGDYIQMGTYYDEPILWRCVSFEKIKGYDDDGNPIMDATDTVTEYREGYLPLMISHKILCFKPFDASGSNIAGSHGRESEYYISDGRVSNGSNYWGDSNIRCWLNSSESTGNIIWSCGNSPIGDAVQENDYANEDGFLKNFSNIEREAIENVTQKSILDKSDSTVNESDKYIILNTSTLNGTHITYACKNYESLSSEFITDKLFLPDVKQFYNIAENDSFLGNNEYWIGEPTQVAIERSDHPEQTAGKRTCLSRTPCIKKTMVHSGIGSHYVEYGNYICGIRNGYIDFVSPYNGAIGVRPAFFLKNKVMFASGDGTDGNPYKIEDNSGEDTEETTVSEFEIGNGYCIENNTNALLGSISISGNSKSIDDVTSTITWSSSDESVLEIGEISYINSIDEKSAIIDIDIIGHKIGKVTITGTTANGKTAEAIISVEPRLNSLNYGTIFSPATIEYEISTASDDKEYFKEFLSSLSYDITAVFSAGISVESTDYVINSDGKNAVYIINVTPTLNLTDNTIKLTSLYGQTADIDIRVQKKNGFSIKNDGWSFANSEFSFSGQVMRDGILGNFKNEYIMPLEIYEQVYGSAYIAANNITTGELFGGYCQGMSDTAILFYDELLKWYEINNLYEESFNTVNSYYDAINYYIDTAEFNKQYYVTSNPYSEVTRLIECYQLWGNHVGCKSVSSTFLDIETYCTSNEEGNYQHLSYENGGTYVEDALEKIRQAVIDDTPLLVGMNYQAGGHAIVARTDKMPEDEGNGWWKVFVYNPNKPYINDDILNAIYNEESNYDLLQKSCNELLINGDDDYIELNPSRNLWRYNTSLTSGSTEDLIGCDENEEVKIMTKEGETDNYSIPEFFWIQNPKDYFAGTFENPNRSWLPSETENTITIQLTDGSDFEIYSANRVLLAKAAKGYGISYDDDIYFLPYVNSDSKQGGTTGELVIPKDKYQIEVNNGNLRIWGHDNVISLDASAGVSATLDIVKNKIDLTSNDNSNIVLLMSNVGGADEYDIYKLTGELKENDNIIAELPDGKPLKTESNTKDVVSVYHNSDKQENETYEYTIGEASKSTHSGGSGLSSYIVKFNSNGGSTVANQNVKKNGVATKPADPTKEGYVFAGWYTDSTLKNAYDFTTKVTKGFSLYAKWEDVKKSQIILTIGEKEALVFGEIKENDVAPKIVKDRTMLPIRFIAEALGSDVIWNEAEPNKVIIKKDDIEIVINVGNDTALVDGKKVELDSPAFIENDRTYLPLRFVSENLGAKVEWDEGNQTVIITK